MRLQRKAAVLRMRLRVRVRAGHRWLQASDSGAGWHWPRRRRCAVLVRVCVREHPRRGHVHVHEVEGRDVERVEGLRRRVWRWAGGGEVQRQRRWPLTVALTHVPRPVTASLLRTRTAFGHDGQSAASGRSHSESQ
jgi:hypothetical protein